MTQLSFVLGGARSGKSSYAERRATQESAQILYIATGQGLDAEMRSRIAAHRQKRAATWQTLELPTGVGSHLLSHPTQAQVVLLDCVTLLVSNLVLQASPNLDHPDETAARALVEAEVTDLLRAIELFPVHWIVVSNEVGHGLVPANPVGRIFRDLLGWANQRLAADADEVLWMVAGIPVPIGDFRKG